MNRQRFQELAEAYGAELARWPVAVREDAALLLAQDPAFARGVLSREGALDEALDALPRPKPAASLYDRIVAQAPAPRRRFLPQWFAPAGLGAALASVAAAGVVLGAQIGADQARIAEANAQAIADLDVVTVAEIG